MTTLLFIMSTEAMPITKGDNGFTFSIFIINASYCLVMEKENTLSFISLFLWFLNVYNIYIYIFHCRLLIIFFVEYNNEASQLARDITPVQAMHGPTWALNAWFSAVRHITCLFLTCQAWPSSVYCSFLTGVSLECVYL